MKKIGLILPLFLILMGCNTYKPRSCYKSVDGETLSRIDSIEEKYDGVYIHYLYASPVAPGVEADIGERTRPDGVSYDDNKVNFSYNYNKKIDCLEFEHLYFNIKNDDTKKNFKEEIDKLNDKIEYLMNRFDKKDKK